MAKKTNTETKTEFAFFLCLEEFINQEHKKIYASLKPLSKKYLEYNNNPTSFLREPQFRALETYVILKEFCGNKRVWEIFEDWYEKKDEFEGRAVVGADKSGQLSLFGPSELTGIESKEAYANLFKAVKDSPQDYANYIFALTMGLGKTILMASCIFYEFLLASTYPKNINYCQNVLVFAPDKTVLGSLKEIQTFDKSKVVPPEYLSKLEANINFHYLDDSGSLNIIDNSKYNVVITNTQKVILKRDKKEKTRYDELFGPDSTKYAAHTFTNNWGEMAKAAGLDSDDEIDNAVDMLSNQRFQKLLTLPQLGIYIDEAHHVYGNKLSDDLYSSDKASSLRVTVNELSDNLKRRGSKLVGCYNFTGTPYVKNRVLPDVVYSYGLKQAIDNNFLKRPYIQPYLNIRDKTEAFCKDVITDFWNAVGQRRVENMLPKIAFFATNIDELKNELRPAVNKALEELGIDTDKVLVNVGDDKITTNDDLREFNSLDTPASNKQFILLCNKGKEGWNCRSLFGVAMHRNPKSTVFVLQATMRCLRQIGEKGHQETGYVYLSKENEETLDKELASNYNVSIDSMGWGNNPNNEEKHTAEVRLVKPIKIKLKKIHKKFDIKEKQIPEHVDFDIENYDLERYKVKKGESELIKEDKEEIKNIKEVKVEQYHYSNYMLIYEIARYIGNNIQPSLVKRVLENSKEGINSICNLVNEYNQVLYDEIIPRFFGELYEIEEYEKKEEIEVELVKEPKETGFYVVSYKKPELLASMTNAEYNNYQNKSFNVDNYCFDSLPEKEMFWALLKDQKLKQVWFTGMLTAGQTDFYISYIDPESHALRSYYPDFLVEDEDGNFTIVEVKGDNKIDDKVVLAKAAYAQQIASASQMKYQMIKGSEAGKGLN